MAQYVSDRQGGDGEDRPSGASILSIDDVALVDRCRRGDMQAFAALIAKYQDRLYNLLWHLCHPAADAERLAQDAFLAALDRLGQLRRGEGFRDLLYRIAVDLTIRRPGRQPRPTLPALPDSADDQAAALRTRLAPAATPGPDAGQLAMAALEELGDDFRVVVLLRELEEMDYAAIGRVLGVAASEVADRLHRARVILHAKLGERLSPGATAAQGRGLPE